MKFKNLIITSTIFGIFLFSNSLHAKENYENKSPANIMVQECFSEYMSKVQNKLRATWQPPDFLAEAHVKVYFKLNRQGRIVSSGIIESSGNDIYDESAIDALKRAEPFGEFPEQTLKEHIAIKYSFDTVLIEEERMKGYYELAKQYSKINPQKALEYIDMAINEVGGEEASGFLYKMRADIKTALGDNAGAREDFDIYESFANKAKIKRIHLLKYLTETQNSAYIYHYLAFAYEEIGDYKNALDAINKALLKADFNSEENIRHYKNHLETLVNKTTD